MTDPNAPASDLTKREHFAALAMHGICSNPKCIDLRVEMAAAYARESADALITELNNTEPQPD